MRMRTIRPAYIVMRPRHLLSPPLLAALRRTAVFALPIVIYAAAAIPLAVKYRERLNVDAVCYIRRAMYWAGGDFYHALSGYWSPLISWTMVPLLKAGVDPLYSARIVMCACGAVAIIPLGLLLMRLGATGFIWTCAALSATALTFAAIAVREITPDLLLAACLLAYLAALTRQSPSASPRADFLAGMLGGLAYLAKAYAFPFVLVHLPLTMLLFRGRLFFRPLLRALAGFLLLALPWIAAISWRYGALTISTAGPRAHAVLAPDNPSREHRWTMTVPPDPYVLEFENPETMPYRFWSPLADRRCFLHQLRIVYHNLFGTPPGAYPPVHGLLATIADFDLLRLSIVALLAAPLAAARLLERSRQRLIVAWLAATVALYCAGFLPVFYIPRYIQPLAAPLCLALALLIALHTRFLPPALRRAAAGVVFFSFTASAWNSIPGDARATGQYRILAARLCNIFPSSPIAGSDRRNLAFLALHSGRKAVAIPLDGDPPAIDAELAVQGIAVLVVWPLRQREMSLGVVNMAERVARTGRWRLAFHFGPPDGGADVYVRTEADRPATLPDSRPMHTQPTSAFTPSRPSSSSN